MSAWTSQLFDSPEEAIAAVEARSVIEPAIGDLVRYTVPWNSQVITTERVYEVRGITHNHDMHEYARSLGRAELEPLIVTKYFLVDAARPNDASQYCWPVAGEPDCPLRFEVVTLAPPVESDLLDILGWSTP